MRLYIDIKNEYHKIGIKKFVKDGYGQSRYNLMYNDFVIIGPYNDPANIESYHKVIDVFQKFTRP